MIGAVMPSAAQASRKRRTGHYARVLEGGADSVGDEDPRVPLLRTATDPGKDQSYVLAALAPASILRFSQRTSARSSAASGWRSG